jgi:hypothetical protein
MREQIQLLVADPDGLHLLTQCRLLDDRADAV